MKTRSFARRVLSVLVALAFVAPSCPVASPAVAAPLTMDNINITLTSTGRTLTFPAGSAISTASVVTTSVVTGWVNRMGSLVDKGMSNATLKLNKKRRRLDFKPAVTGYKLNRATAQQQIIAALLAEVGTGTSSTVALSTTVIKPKVTKFGKTILVSLNLRKIYLYDNKKVIKTYRCAVGQPRWPTPTGTFRIGRKVRNPSWTNGYASWSRNMPSYIGPSPNNPLGTRAMYVYKGKSDTGVRFHGVPHSEDSSIGHAASHGCLRMHRKDVENFFPRVTVGTTVYIIK